MHPQYFPFPARRSLAVLPLLILALAAQAEEPIVAWIQRYNGPGNNTDTAYAVTTDRSNRVIVTGTSLGSTTGWDYATVQYSSQGVPLWTNRYNGPGNANENAVAVVVDGNNNVIVTGYSGAGTNNDYVTIKYSSAGVPVWTNRYGGAGGTDDRAYALGVDRSNNVVVTGICGGDYGTVQYSSAGVALWTNRYNGPANGLDTARAIAVDSGNNVIVTGGSPGGGIGSDYVTIKYSRTGVPLWTNRYNGPANSIDEPSAVVVDGLDNVIVTGRSVAGGYYSFGTIKYSSAGVPVWTNYYREPSGTTAYANALAVDRNNNVFVTGYWFAGLYEDFATVAYSSGGTPLWTNRYDAPASRSDVARAIAVDDNNNVIVSGYSSGDYATIKYSNSGIPLWTNRYNGPGNGGDSPWALAIDHNGDVIVAGDSDGGSSGWDFTTMKFISPPIIAGLQTSNGLCELQLRRPNLVVIEASTDLVNWTSLVTNRAATNLFVYVDPASSSYLHRFYRAVRAP